MNGGASGAPRDEARVGLAFDPGLRERDPETVYADATRIAELIAGALRAGGLGTIDPAAPLCDVIAPGQSVLLKPNWVLHEHPHGRGIASLITHPAFVLAALDQACRARPARVVIGDAPIQMCDFERIATAEFRASAAAIARAHGVTVEIVDFRRRIVDSELAREVRDDARPVERYVLADLGAASLLDPISEPPGRFRVTNYDQRRLAESHAPGRHRYLLAREAFEADVVLSLPKLKTHCKAGLTAALKNLVGVNGNKDFLPHHRLGGASAGGDCYPGSSWRKKLAEFCLDRANERIGQPGYETWFKLAFAQWRGVGAIEERGLEGAWFGNDTVWRMVLDLARLLVYGRSDGTLARERQRTVFTLTDALVVGEGDGPLLPLPRTLGAVTFARSMPFADLAHAALIGFDWERVPLVRESFGAFEYPLVQAAAGACVVRLADEDLSPLAAARRVGLALQPPGGWAGHVELADVLADRPASR